MTININRIIQETSRVQPHLIAGFHGERIRLEVSYRSYGATVSIAGATVTFYWRTDADEPGHWHEAAGSVVDGAAVAEWGPTMDAGPDDVQWFLRVDADGDTSFRAAGVLRLLPSPGFDPAVLPPATVTLDFATIQVLNAPYWTQEEADARFASVADATLNGRGPNHDGYSAWETNVAGVTIAEAWMDEEFVGWYPAGEGIAGIPKGAISDTSLTWDAESEWGGSVDLTATRTALPGYVLGSQTDKPLPKLSDVPAVVAPSTDAADKGKAADAKAVGDALAGKLGTSGGTVNGSVTVLTNEQGDGHGFWLSDPDTGAAFRFILSEGHILLVGTISGQTFALTFPFGTTDDVALEGDLPAAEIWTFEVDDGQGGTETVTKSVAVFAAAQGGTP